MPFRNSIWCGPEVAPRPSGQFQPNTWKLRCKYYGRNYKTTAMFCKKSYIYLRLSSLATALPEETAEETKVTFVREGGVGVSRDARFEPT